jgi:hypothetical protein
MILGIYLSFDYLKDDDVKEIEPGGEIQIEHTNQARSDCAF